MSLRSQAPVAAIRRLVRGGYVDRAQSVGADERGDGGGAEAFAEELAGESAGVQPTVSDREKQGLTGPS